jgi:glycosyltransferase involved in cell wall biosynthesis
VKVGIVTLRPEFELSGEYVSTVQLINHLKINKIECSMLSPDSSRPKENNMEYSKTGDVVFGKIFSMVLFLFRLRWSSKEYDILHIYLPTPAFSIIADIVKFGIKTPLIVFYESSIVDRPLSLFRYFFKDFPFYVTRMLINNRFVARLSLFKADKYVVSTKYQKQQLLSLGIESKKISLCFNISKSFNYKNIDRESARKALNLQNRLYVCYIGNFLHLKGLESLIKSFTDVVKEIPDSTLILAYSGIGSKKRIDYLLQRDGLEKKTIILGKVDVGLLLSASDVFVLPYLHGFGTNLIPNLVLEALSVNIPLISSLVPPIKEVIMNRKEGILVDPNDHKSLASEIIRLLKDKNLADTIRSNQRRKYEECFVPENLVKRYIELYEEFK